MRYFAANEAQHRATHGRFTTIARMANNWKTRKALRQLLCLDDQTLRDIGLSRVAVEHLLALPLTADTLWETERLRRIASQAGLGVAAE
jgi:uncharacterized protein YjiS (DUF1127 family)